MTAARDVLGEAIKTTAFPQVTAPFCGTMGTENEGGSGAGETAPSRGQHLCGGAVMAHRTCSTDGCSEPIKWRDWCSYHYNRLNKHRALPPLPTAEDRFLAKLGELDENGCILWLGKPNSTGYARFRAGGREVQVHRFAYEWLVGPIPDGLELDHLCQVPLCCNPDHLEPVTHAENLRRVGIRQTSCRKAGHDWTDPNNVRIDRNGHRFCAECDRIRKREDWARRSKANAERCSG